MLGRVPEPTDSFINSFKKGFDTPILSTPILRVTRKKGTQDEDFVPKRSIRLAAKSGYRELRPEKQVHKSPETYICNIEERNVAPVNICISKK